MSKEWKWGVFVLGGLLGIGALKYHQRKKEIIPCYWWINSLKQQQILREGKKQGLNTIHIMDVWEYDINDNLSRLTVLLQAYNRFFIYGLVWDKNIVSKINDFELKDFTQAIEDSSFKEISLYEAQKWHGESFLGV